MQVPDRSARSVLQASQWEYRGDRPLRTLFNLYRSSAGNIGLSMLFFVIKHSPVWVQPLVIANIIDIISQPAEHSLTQLWLNGGFLAVFVVQNIPTNYLHVRFRSAVTRGMEANLRSAIVRQLQDLSIGFYIQNSKGALQSKLLRDVEAIQQLANHIFEFMPATVLTILVAIGVTAVRVPWFLAFYAGTVPLAVVLVRSLREPIRVRNQKLRRQMEDVSAHLIEMLSLIPITRAHGAEDTEIDRTDLKLLGVKEAAMRVDSINAIANATSWVSLRMFSITCLALSGWLAYTGQLGMTPGSVILLMGYFDSLTNSVAQLMNVLPQIGKGFDAIQSVGEILECPDIERNQGKAAVSRVKGEFNFQSVQLTYPSTSRPAIATFSLHVQPGETIALVGPSGAGKSTLINLVIGFLRPTSGRILLDGCNMELLDLRTYRRFLAVVSQETILFEGTVRDNVLYGLEGVDDEQLRQVLRDANAWSFVRELPEELDTLIGENGTKLSGGQRQRIAIARALIRDPRVLILDEATSSLDSVSEALIQEAMERLIANRTSFVVAHRLSTIRKADRIVVLEKGRIVEVGNHRELVTNRGTYAQLHELQT
jgi:ATP-binding cassette subfamily B protein